MTSREGSDRRDVSPSGRAGRRTDAHDENREVRDGSKFNDAAGEHPYDRHADDRQRMRYRKHTDDRRYSDDVSHDHSRRQHDTDARDGRSRTRLDDGSHRTKHSTDDSNRGRSRHVVDADADVFGTEHHQREYRHRESSTREEYPRGRSSDRDKKMRHEEGYSHSGYRRDYEKTNTRLNHHRNTDGDIGREHLAAGAVQGNEDILPELFSVHRAKVQSVRPFGVFVRLEGFYKQGLVHLSQLSDHEVTDREDSDEMKVKAIAAVAGEGDHVWVKVISLKDDGGSVKIGCSLKLVSQSSGKDLDPNNLKLNQQQPKANRQEIKKVTLDAIYNVVCTRCGGHGHLKNECYAMADKTYELIPEDEPVFEAQPEPPQVQTLLEGMTKTGTIPKPGFGRGRAMVLPAWMTHGSGSTSTQAVGSIDNEKKKRKASSLPDKISTVEEAMALMAEVKKAKKGKHRHKEHRKHRKDKKSKRSSKKDRSSLKDTG